MSDGHVPIGRLRVHGGGVIRFTIKGGELYAFIDPRSIEDKGVIILKNQPEEGLGTLMQLPDRRSE